MLEMFLNKLLAIEEIKTDLIVERFNCFKYKNGKIKQHYKK